MRKNSFYFFKNLFEEDLIPINKKNSEKIKRLVNGASFNHKRAILINSIIFGSWS